MLFEGNEYFRLIQIGVLKPCDGSFHFSDLIERSGQFNRDVFESISRQFQFFLSQGKDVKPISIETNETKVGLYEIVPKTIHFKIFESITRDISKISLTDHQIREWVRLNQIKEKSDYLFFSSYVFGESAGFSFISAGLLNGLVDLGYSDYRSKIICEHISHKLIIPEFD